MKSASVLRAQFQKIQRGQDIHKGINPNSETKLSAFENQEMQLSQDIYVNTEANISTFVDHWFSGIVSGDKFTLDHHITLSELQKFGPYAMVQKIFETHGFDLTKIYDNSSPGLYVIKA